MAIEQSIINLFGIITGFSIVGFIIWNSSKKATTTEIKVQQIDKKQDKDITELRREHNDDITNLRKALSDDSNQLIKAIGDARVERKEEITKAIINQHERLRVLQEQIDATKSDVKDLSTRITVSGTKSDQFEREIERLCKETAEHKLFISEWIQRVEDRVKETNNYIFDIFKNNKKS